MTRNRRIILALVLIGVVLLLVLQRQRGLDWQESYDLTSRAPYGTQVLYAAMKRQYIGRDVVRLERMKEQLRTETDEAAGGAAYFFVGYGWSVKADEAAALRDFVAAGNDALVIARHLPVDFLTDFLGFGGCGSAYEAYEAVNEVRQTLRLRHPSLDATAEVRRVEDYDTVYTRWQYFQWPAVCDTVPEYIALGDMKTADGRFYPNFVAIPYGEGRFLLHTTPLAFGNYHAIQPANQAYITQVLAHLSDQGGPIYWDASHGLMGQPRPLGGTGEESAGMGGGNAARFGEQTPLAYVLSQPSLAWAWYVLLATAVLYVWFGAKRRQRPIPVRAPRENTTLEFIETVGMLRWQQKQHGRLMAEQYKLWLYDVNTRYGLMLNAQTPPDGEALEALAKASGLLLERLMQIVAAFAECRSAPQRMTEGDLSRGYALLEAYYRDRK